MRNLYGARAAAEPGKGNDEKAAEWRAKLEAMQPSKSQNAETPKPRNDPDSRSP